MGSPGPSQRCFCGRCGAEASAGAAFCPKCGNELRAQTVPSHTAGAQQPERSEEAASSGAHSAGPGGPTTREMPARNPVKSVIPPSPIELPSALRPSSPAAALRSSSPTAGRVPVARLVAALLAVAAVGAGVILILGGGAHSHHGAARASDRTLSTSRAGVQVDTTGTSTDTSTTTSADAISEARSAIAALLRSYQKAYSGHDVSALSQLFAPMVVRHGLAAGGCRVSHGRAAVLADYESQFTAGSGTYRLVGLSPADVDFSGPQAAHVSSRYEITPGGSGSVGFAFAREAGEWKISQVDATCS
jgi:hypothetical protein